MITVTAVQTVRPGREAELDRLMADLTNRVLAPWATRMAQPRFEPGLLSGTK